ncbi:MAG: nucleotidyl transferase AbiEii/AbiGii toxin family protein [Acidobacteriota bacterium]
MHTEVMTLPQRRALRMLGPPSSRHGFVLAGGTAVALHLGHRRSVDLDWFTDRPFPDPLAFAALLRSDGISFETQEVSTGTLHGEAARVRVSYLEFRYPLLEPPLPWPGGKCALASLADLSAMKLAALAQRGARKDFADIFALAREYRPLPELVGLYQRKFGIKDPGHLLFALAYFDDADGEPMPAMLWPVRWGEIKKSLRAALKSLA